MNKFHEIHSQFLEPAFFQPLYNINMRIVQRNNEDDMGLELEKGLQLFFQKNKNKLSLILFLCFLGCSFTL
jgi:hypothetical protein